MRAPGHSRLALADLLGPGARIVAVDRDARALGENERAVRARFPAVELTTLTADLTGPLDLPAARRPRRGQQPPLRAARAARWRSSGPSPRTCEPGGRFVVVEYDADRGNPWVPHPFSYRIVGAARRGGGPRRDAADRARAEPIPRCDLRGREPPSRGRRRASLGAHRTVLGSRTSSRALSGSRASIRSRVRPEGGPARGAYALTCHDHHANRTKENAWNGIVEPLTPAQSTPAGRADVRGGHGGRAEAERHAPDAS